MSCDRRISRAARHILIHDTLPILQHHHPKHTHRCHHGTTTTVVVDPNMIGKKTAKRQLEEMRLTLDLYATLLADLMTTPGTCVLDPTRDPFWKDEREYNTRSSQYAARRRALTARRTKDQLHVCWMCDKKFVSRFYFDLHLKGHRNDATLPIGSKSKSSSTEGVTAPIHTDDGGVSISSDTNDATAICPAEELCYHLGGGGKGRPERCRHRALADEPYYASGHPEDPATRRSHRRNATRTKEDVDTAVYGVVCDEDEMAVRRRACRVSFGFRCFGGKDALVEDIAAVLCDGTWSCKDRMQDIHREVRDDDVFARRGMHFRREEWFWHHDEVKASPISVMVLLLIYVIYHLCVYGVGDFGFGRKQYNLKIE